jgi:hypothetical protein
LLIEKKERNTVSDYISQLRGANLKVFFLFLLKVVSIFEFLGQGIIVLKILQFKENKKNIQIFLRLHNSKYNLVKKQNYVNLKQKKFNDCWLTFQSEREGNIL